MDVELSRAETQLQSEEAALHAELSRLAQVSGELSGRLSALRSQAAQAGEAAIAQRAQVEPPPVDPNAGFDKARASREAAVRVRREVNAVVRAQLALLKGSLRHLRSQPHARCPAPKRCSRSRPLRRSPSATARA